MKRITYIAGIVLAAATLLGIFLQMIGVESNESGLASDMHRLGLSPMLWPLLFPAGGAIVLLLIVTVKKRPIAALWREEKIGKAGAITAASVLFGPVLALMLQAFVGLRFFELIDKNAMITGLALLQSMSFLIFGNYIATAKRLIGGGFNTPWTRNSKLVWRKTQRFLGRGIMVVTLFSLVALYFASPKAIILAQIAAIMAMKGISVIYSYVLWRQENARRAYDVN